ncbi:Retrovirus-related Pol polyprotein from transposon TNT 1-94 [Sesbania bispinosa]|nr:Retrovirus-related Pol polyprotein from transposon TNT 1-94 [Sesbania bispinosa]
MLEVFINEVEKQLDRKVKVVRSDRGGEFYGKTDESGQCAEVMIYNPHEKKLDGRTISGYFIDYPKKSKGYKFYCPNHSMRIVESGNARFIENGQFSGSEES